MQTQGADTGEASRNLPWRFELRWRVREGKVLLFNRHIRELTHFDLTPALVAWVHERLEWAAVNLLSKDSEGVMVLTVDPAAEVSVSFARYEPPGAFDLAQIVEQNGCVAGLSTGEPAWPSTVWLAHKNGSLTACLPAGTPQLYLAVDTLAQQLAHTQGIKVVAASVSPEVLKTAQAVFALSGEHGFIPLSGQATAAELLSQNFARLFGQVQ